MRERKKLDKRNPNKSKDENRDLKKKKKLEKI